KSYPGKYAGALSGRTMALLFEKPSLRTRVTFETGVFQMGGYGIYLAPGDIGLGTRESVPDAARNLSRWLDVVVARTFSHQVITDLARFATIPVVNALSDDEHPCQALADLLTLYERWKDLREVRLAYVGDGNNVCNSLLLLCAMVGTSMAVATPAGYDPPERFVEQARQLAARSGAEILITTDPEEAARGSQAVYTDVWASMGREEESEKRRKIFSGYQVNARLMKQAGPQALFLHCLPAHRGEEVTDEVMDSAQSVVFDQAENRLHIQKAILYRLMAKPGA
ncbi:MAG TPA: ornithine carbamoyltransferase, partial [Firmicutes bacterium]|nr:ornithine carbamoyltransferase [Bacillota bacterium]